jgi:hypothetical protein
VIKAFVRYLLGSLLYGVEVYLFWQIVWPGEHTMVSTFSGALTFGLIMRSTAFLRDLLGLKEDDPYPPLVYFVFGIGGLVVTAAFWYRTQQIPPTGFKLIGAGCIVGLSLYQLALGIRRMRQGIALGGEVLAAPSDEEP